MVRRSVRLTGPDADSVAALTARFDQVRTRLGVPAAFPPEVLAAAEQAAAAPSPPDVTLTEIPFVTIDPPGSTDLDQAMFLSRRAGGGYHVDYAIADVPAFLAPGGAIDEEAMRRGQTLYAPDRRTPLHPQVLSEGAASLLPDVDRPAFVWRLDLDEHGESAGSDLVRALVRSRHRLDYATVQAAADAHPDTGDHSAAVEPGDAVAQQAVLLREIGLLRLAAERARGGASLPLPAQEVSADGATYRLQLRPALASEDWNAQISLLTGMAAAQLMMAARIGILRTLPRPDAGLLARFGRQAAALGVPWPDDQPYGEFLAGLDRVLPAHLALLHEAGALFRGAGYIPFDGSVPAESTHAAVAAPYAHVTAPLRRLVDRFGLVACHAIRQGRPVPDWVRARLAQLPPAMAASDQLAGRLEHGCLDIVEAAVLADRVGQTFDAVVVDLNHSGGKVQVLDPAVLAACAGPLTLGASLRVRLDGADPATGTVRFSPAT